MTTTKLAVQKENKVKIISKKFNFILTLAIIQSGQETTNFSAGNESQLPVTKIALKTRASSIPSNPGKKKTNFHIYAKPQYKINSENTKNPSVFKGCISTRDSKLPVPAPSSTAIMSTKSDDIKLLCSTKSTNTKAAFHT